MTIYPYAVPRGVAGSVSIDGALAKGKHNPVDATSGNRTMTLPTGVTAGSVLSVEKTDSSANTVTISGTIRGGSSTITMYHQYDVMDFVAETSSSWRPIGEHRTKAALDSDYAPLGLSVPQAIQSRSAISADTGNITAGLSQVSRMPHIAPADLSDIRLHYLGQASDQVPASQFTVQCGIEYNGLIYKGWFNGARIVTMQPGGYAECEPIPVQVKEGDTFWVRTYAIPNSGSDTIPDPLYGDTSVSIKNLAADSTQQTLLDTVGAIAWGTSAPTYTAAVVSADRATRNGIPLRLRCLAVIGDSGSYGQQDNPAASPLWGAVGRSLYGGTSIVKLGLSVMQIGHSGDKVQQWVGGQVLRRQALRWATHAHFHYGVNDAGAGRTAAQIEADFITAWLEMWRRGATNTAATIPPNTTSTDSWATVGNQTAFAGESVRVAVNTWLRDGAPLDSSTYAAVATGTATSGTIVRAGAARHPLSAYVEFADYVESARNSGKWKASNTGDGLHANATGYQAIADGWAATPATGVTAARYA